MFRGFELKNLRKDIFNDSFEKYLRIGETDFDKYELEIGETIKEFNKIDGSIDGDKMQSAWFPQFDADIFLSHSHADKDLVIAFAGWLKNFFDLKVFVDSCIWGHSKILQNIIDEKYSKIGDRKYDYDKALYASSHVHMMLNTALMQMIDNCECIIFLNTPNSVKPTEVINKVVSPWIYSEIGMTKLIKRKKINEHRFKKLYEETKTFSAFEIEYNLDTKHLTQLTITDLINWKNSFANKSGYALDYLYKLKSINLS